MTSNHRRAWIPAIVLGLVLFALGVGVTLWTQILDTPDRTPGSQASLRSSALPENRLTPASGSVKLDQETPASRLLSGHRVGANNDLTGVVIVKVQWEKSGQPAAGILIVLDTTHADGRQRQFALAGTQRGTTGPDGSVVFRGVDAGRYFVLSDQMPASGRSFEVEVKPRSEESVAILLGDSGERLRGTVVNGEGHPVPDATIYGVHGSIAQAVARTNSDGTFEVQSTLTCMGVRGAFGFQAPMVLDT